MMNKKKLSTVGLLILSLILISSVAVAEEDLELVSERGSHTEAWKTLMDNFEQEVGTNLNLTQYPYSDYRSQLMLNFTGGQNNYDVPYISMLWYPSFARGGYLKPLNEIVERNPDLKEDMPGLENAYSEDGNLYFIPYMNELGGVLYRKDLFNDPEEKKNFKEQYGYELQPPKTLQQYKDIAEFFHRPPDLYGVSLMGQKSIFLATHFMNRLWARGGELLDDDYKPAFNNEEGIEALKEVKEMFKYSSDASKSHDFQDALTEFTNGKSAMAELWTTAMFHANDEETSDIVGDASFTGFPRPEEAKDEKRPMLYISWGFSVTESTDNPEAAMEWIEHVIEKEQFIEAAPEGTIPTRLSALEDSELRSELPWIEPFQEALENGIPTPMSPLIPEGSTIVNEEIASAVSEYLIGEKSSQEALSGAENAIYDLLEENNYYE